MIDDDLSPTMFVRRSLDAAVWLIPSVILAFMPKCPACFAAYIAIGTGLGLSMATATTLRVLLIALCLGSLLLLASKYIRRWRQDCMPKTAAPQMGYFVVCQDTEDNTFALWEPNESAK